MSSNMISPHLTRSLFSISADKTYTVLFDTYGIAYRAHHGTKSHEMTTTDGDTNTSTLFTYTRMMLSYLRNYLPIDQIDCAIACMDHSDPTLRQQEMETYKLNRSPMPELLKNSLPLIEEANSSMSIPSVSLSGYEADDIIATFTKQCVAQDRNVIIVSADKDLFQLVNEEKVQVFDPSKKILYDEQAIIKKYGFPPNKVAHFLALVGDKADHLPGIPKIGPKTAERLINEFGTIDQIVDNADLLKPAIRNSLLEHSEMLEQTLGMIKLKDSTPISFDIDKAKFDLSHETLLKFLGKYEFKSIINQLSKESPEIHQAVNSIAVHEYVDGVYDYVSTEKQLDSWIQACKEAKSFALFSFLKDSGLQKNNILGLSLCLEQGRATFIPFLGEKAFDPKVVLAKLDPLLADPDIHIVTHDAKPQLKTLQRIISPDQAQLKYEPHLCNIDDTMVMSYALYCGLLSSTSLATVAKVHLHKTLIPLKTITGGAASTIKTDLEDVEISILKDYACQNADFSLSLYEKFGPQLETTKMLSLYQQCELPLISTLADMELTGVMVDSTALDMAGNKFDAKRIEIETEIYALAEQEFNINSPKQLGELLFDKLNIKSKHARKSTTSQNWKTGSEVLQALAKEGHKIPQLVLNHRAVAKLSSTYVNGLKEQINPDTHRVHTQYQNAKTVTGRLSSVSPNLQNIPTRSQDGKLIRQAFRAKPGCKLVFADYSQVELRILAHIADIPQLKAAFQQNIDVHSLTASQVFKCSFDNVPKDLRSKAKAINFGIIYGMSEYGLAKQLGVDRHEAQLFIKSYFAQYPGIQNYIKDTIKFCRKNGFVNTIFGRRCYVPDINTRHPRRRGFVERTAINTPIQGTSADITKIAMNRCYDAFRDFETKLIMQVHDEIIFEVPESEIELVLPIIKQQMESVADSAKFSVPLIVDTDVRDRWA